MDFPDIQVDMKVASYRQPQSSCPFQSARQKVYGLGYSLLVFVYEKTDDRRRSTGRLRIQHVIFVEATRTADFQLTSGLLAILDNDGNKDDLVSFMSDRMLPGDEITLSSLADEVLDHPPPIGCLTISNALQWRLQYGRAIDKAGSVAGVVRVA